MPAPPADHDNVLVYRLVQLLIKLNQGEKLDPQALAEEFGVTRRTLQRDLNERLAYLPLEKIDGRYRLNPAFLGKISARDIEHFASLAGVRGLFPSLSADFLRDVFDARLQSARLVKGPHYEDLGGREHGFEALEQAILARRHIAYAYRKTEGLKSYTDVEPYKLINHNGIWYLAARDGGQLKSFCFTKIERLQVLETTFAFDAAVDKTLRQEDGIWLNETKIEVVLTVAKDAAGYFKRRPLVAHQVIDKELADGGLIVSARVAHINQILPIVRHWIPHVRIISPEGLQAEMESQMHAYLHKL
jgi:predicted DNA-binding transcriptional regulator YafY